MSETTVVLKVGMSCQGCVGAVQRVLGKMEGVDSFDINMEEQKVTVKGNVQPEAVLQTVSKTGKKTSFWEPETAAAPQGNPVEAKATEPNPVETTPKETKPAEVEPETKPTDEAVAAT